MSLSFKHCDFQQMFILFSNISDNCIVAMFDQTLSTMFNSYILYVDQSWYCINLDFHRLIHNCVLSDWPGMKVVARINDLTCISTFRFQCFINPSTSDLQVYFGDFPIT